MKEIEIKALLGAPCEAPSLDTLRTRAVSMGFTPAHVSREEDHYFNGTERDFRKTDEALRLRIRTRGDETACFVTYKGPKEDVRSQTRRELQTRIEDPGTAHQILECLGFQDVFVVAKTRESLHGHGDYEGMTLCLDQVDSLGPALEIEKICPETISAEEHDQVVAALLSVLNRLGVPEAGLTQQSYLEILLRRAASTS